MKDYKGKYPIRTRKEGEFLTLNQLTKKGMSPKDGCNGVEMYTNETHQRTAIYYRLEDAEPSEAAKDQQREQRQKKAAKRREHYCHERDTYQPSDEDLKRIRENKTLNRSENANYH